MCVCVFVSTASRTSVFVPKTLFRKPRELICIDVVRQLQSDHYHIKYSVSDVRGKMALSYHDSIGIDL